MTLPITSAKAPLMARLRMPAEHGAWGILLVSFFSAAVVGGAWNLPLLLAAVCVLALFLVRGSVESYGKAEALMLPEHLALAAVAGTTGGWLVILYQRLDLVALALAAAALYTLHAWLAHERQGQAREKRSLAAELLGTLIVTLAAPAAWIAARGSLDGLGAAVWLLNLVFFTGGVLYVKYRVRGLRAHRTFTAWRERLEFAWPVLAYHAAAVLLLAAAAAIFETLSLLVLAAFAPALLRALGLLFHLGRVFPIRRLGWSEVAHSLVFAVLLVLALRAS